MGGAFYIRWIIHSKGPLEPRLSSDKLNDRLNDELNPPARSTYLIIKENPGIQRKELSERTGERMSVR